MLWELLGVAIAFICGGLVSTANYFITKNVIKSDDVSLKYYKSALIRLAICAVFAVAVFLLSNVLPWNRYALFIGAAAGATLPLAAYTALLIKKRD